MTRAALFLHTVQSNVTARIQRLESHLGITLFARTTRKLRLTAEGETLMPFALELEKLDLDLHRSFDRREVPERGTLCLGAIETFAATKLPHLIARFTSRHPNVEISVETGSTDTLRKKIIESQLDAVFISRPANGPEFFEERVLADELVVIAPRKITSFKDLARPMNKRLRILVQRSDCSFTARLIGHLQDVGIEHRPVHAVGTLEGVISSVRAGSGIAALPRSYLDSITWGATFSQIKMPKPLRALEIFLVVQRWKHPIRLLDAFVKSCTSADLGTEVRAI